MERLLQNIGMKTLPSIINLAGAHQKRKEIEDAPGVIGTKTAVQMVTHLMHPMITMIDTTQVRKGKRMDPHGRRVEAEDIQSTTSTKAETLLPDLDAVLKKNVKLRRERSMNTKIEVIFYDRNTKLVV